MNSADEKHLEWTGERYVPEVTGNIRLEHLHRYLIARELSRDKRVLDIACGEGYGSNLLASVAASVVGVDVAHEAIDHAAARYTRPNLQFKRGACEAIPLPDRAVDVVVSFETLEHLSSHDAMLREFRRVLSADGLLVISSPDRHEYSEVLGNNNAYHVKELYREEFEQLLRSHFLNVALGGQRIQGGSIVAPLGTSTNTSFHTFAFSDDPVTGVNPIPVTVAPVYLLALASDGPLPEMPAGLLDGGEFVWASDVPALSELARQTARVATLEDSLAAKDAQLQDVRTKLAAEGLQLQEATARLAAQEIELDAQQRSSEDAHAQARGLQEALACSRDEAARLAAAVQTYERSRSWRVTAPLRAIRRGLSALQLRAASEEAIANELPDGFDSAAYLALNPDVAASGMDPAHHYASSGRRERRAYSFTLPHGFDAAAYLALNPDVAASGMDAARHYLTSGRHEGRPYLRDLPDGFDPATHPAPNPDVAVSGFELPDGFDPAAYLALNPDVAASGMDPADHYLTSGRHEGRAYARSSMDRRQLPDGFDPAAYLALNPDVAASGMDPADHYVSSGRREGRVYAYPRVEFRGTHHLRADRDSVLVVSHDASRTGAPMVSLNLVSNLVARYNVVVLVLGEGPLIESFEQAGAVTVASHLRRYPVLADSVVGRLHDQFRFTFALVNSIESRVVLRPLAARFVPVVSLVHEFAAYTRPREAFPDALLWSSDVVFSADITRQSVLQQAACADAQSVHTLPQGRCLPPAAHTVDAELERERARLSLWMRPEASGDGAVIILGVGAVHLRKGVDLFIEVAARVMSAPGAGHCRFIWLGNGFDPDGDVHYSVYLADQIQRAGLEEHLFFAGETRAIETAYQEADIFLMSSRLDPMPNVAVDALAHGKPVLCFDKATGIADFLKGSGLGDRCVARYLDTADMAAKIRTLASSRSLRQEVGEKGREASISYFNMADYVTRLEALARKAVDRSRREEQDAELILGSGRFRPDFGVPADLAPLSLESAVRLHVRGWASGIRRRKPFPGFHPGVYLERHGVASEGSDPTADYIRAGSPDGPWNSTVIGDSGGHERDLPANESVALHLHVFYLDLLPDILSRFSSNRCRPDLLVSVTSEDARDVVARHLESYEGKVAAIEVVPNRGRDIGPFLTQFGRRILSEYAYVGHIHTKKTEAVKDTALGKTWFEFLMANLLGGGSGAMADAILASLQADRSLGIVFPDDPGTQGWNANRGFAEALASKMGIKELPQHFNFPVGTMFWARTSALSPLVDLNLQWDDYPPEPLPYDGTLLHAIERLLPLTLGEGPLRAAVTNVTGVTR